VAGSEVFTCHSNSLEEANASYLKYPSGRAVSYVPSVYVKGTTPAVNPATGLYI
jgi:hypothetical protein